MRDALHRMFDTRTLSKDLQVSATPLSTAKWRNNSAANDELAVI